MDIKRGIYRFLSLPYENVGNLIHAIEAVTLEVSGRDIFSYFLCTRQEKVSLFETSKYC